MGDYYCVGVVLNLTVAIQESLICLLCYDAGPKGCKFVRMLVPSKTYDVYYREIAEAADAYISSYDQPPGEHTIDLIQTLQARHPDAAEIYDQIYRSMLQTRLETNAEFVLNQAINFSRLQRIKVILNESIDLIQEPDAGRVLQVENLMMGVRDQSLMTFDAGLRLTDTARSLAFLDDDYQAFPTGIKEIDSLQLGPARKRLHLLLGLYGKGKSRWLLQLAKYAMMHRLKVVYLSWELSETEIAQRFFQCLFSISKRGKDETFQTFEVNSGGHYIGHLEQKIFDRPAFTDFDIRHQLRKHMQVWGEDRLPLIIKQFPTGWGTVKDVEAYLDALQGVEKFIPDLIIVDYPDLMEVDIKFQRESLGKIYKDFRGLAIKRNAAVAAVSQINREGEGAQTLSGKHVAEDFKKMATADVVMTYNQTLSEHALGLARIYVAKGRTDQDRFTVLLSQMYGLGQFCMDSVMMRQAETSYWNKIQPPPDPEEETEEPRGRTQQKRR